MALTAIGLAAPYHRNGTVGELALSSRDPASLFNACRIAALRSDRGTGAWAASNWAIGRRRREFVQLFDSYNAAEQVLEPQLLATRPNLIFIGCMTICLPGAVACASLAKQVLGDNVCVVLGGRHPSESVYADPTGLDVRHHASSPLRLMAEGQISRVFDIVVSGEGEFVVAEIGELVDRLTETGQPAAEARHWLGAVATAPGRWIAGMVESGRVVTITSRGPEINRDLLPAPCEMFGVRTQFDVFGGRHTAHVFSDTGSGCIYDCTFCSERRSVTGVPSQLHGSADRFYRQLEAASRVIQEDWQESGASAFVEDSTLLTNSPFLVNRLAALLEEARLDIQFGGQLTIDQILGTPRNLATLRDVGLTYLFIGLETLVPEEVGGLSKNVGRKRAEWRDRAEHVFSLLRDLKMGCGTALLFGLGEPHRRRLELLEQVRTWQAEFGMPYPVSYNWAVQHPLAGDDGGANYTYLDWAIPDGPYFEALRHFGEASVRYPISGQAPPALSEVQELVETIRSLSAAAEPRILDQSNNQLDQTTAS